MSNPDKTVTLRIVLALPTGAGVQHMDVLAHYGNTLGTVAETAWQSFRTAHKLTVSRHWIAKYRWVLSDGEEKRHYTTTVEDYLAGRSPFGPGALYLEYTPLTPA